MANALIAWVRHRNTYCIFVLPILVLTGCVFNAPSSGIPHPSPGAAGHGYALLFDLLGDEKNVSKLLIIKRERAEFRDLIKQIAERSAAAHKQLGAFAKADNRLNLKDRGLPALELATRESISKETGKQLLTVKGKDLELQLLLTQNEALTYGAHLAAVTAKSEGNPERAQFLRQLSSDLANLQQKVVTMLTARYSWSPAE